MYLALLRELAEPSSELFDHALFPRTQASQITFRCGELNSPILSLMRFFQQLGNVNQSFRRYAATVEADSAWVQLRIDQSDRHAEIGSQKRGRVSTGTAAHHCDVQVRGLRHSDVLSRCFGCAIPGRIAR